MFEEADISKRNEIELQNEEIHQQDSTVPIARIECP